jgi:hypothetical protein
MAVRLSELRTPPHFTYIYIYPVLKFLQGGLILLYYLEVYFLGDKEELVSFAAS